MLEKWAILENEDLKIHAILLIAFMLGLLLRLAILSKYGFSEDEILKILAVQGYMNLDFSKNPAHPSLMKLAITLSILVLGESEFAARLPNAFIGALTVYPLYFLGKKLYNSKTGLFASFFWAVNIPVISFQTTAKEDAFLAFFWTLAVYFYIRATENPDFFRYCGICVGLAFASKFAAFLLVILLLILYFYHRYEGKQLPSIKETALLSVPFGILAFLVASFPLFLLSTLIEWIAWYSPKTPSHTGYFMMGQMHSIRPPYYLLLHILVKNPISFLLLLLIGISFALKDHSGSDKILLIWAAFILAFFSISTYGYVRYYLVVLPALMLLAAQGTCRTSQWIYIQIKKFRPNLSLSVPRHISTMIIVIICLHSLIVGLIVTPYYRMYVNELGGGLDKAGYYFPGDSVYDYLYREAIFYLNEEANQNAVIATMVPPVGEYYGRSDLKFLLLRNLPADFNDWDEFNVSYAIIQESRTYYENEQHIDNIIENLPVEAIFVIFETEVVTIHRLEPN